RQPDGRGDRGRGAASYDAPTLTPGRVQFTGRSVDSMTAACPDERSPSPMTVTHADYQLSQLDQLEAESIHIFREVAAEFEKPVLMFSGGKDSIVMMRLAEKAFYPAKIPFPVLQVDTGYDFPEVLECRDHCVDRLGVRLIVA